MAKSKDMQLIPTGGVLVVALVAAVAAAVLVNWYIAAARSDYTANGKICMQVVKDIPKDTVITSSDIEPVMIPRQLQKEGRFATAITEDRAKAEIIGQKASRNFYKGEFFFFFDAHPAALEAPPPPVGYVQVDIPVGSDMAASKNLHPGSFVKISASFDTTPVGEKSTAQRAITPPVTVFRSVKVVSIDGETGTPASTGGNARRTISFIQIFLKEAVAKQLLQYRSRLVGNRYIVEVTYTPEGPSAEPTIDKDCTELLQRVSAPAAASSPGLPGLPG
jgi:hypothetical protein